MRDPQIDALRMVSRVKIAASEAEKQAIYRLRYEAYVKRQGKHAPGADHVGRLLMEPVDKVAKNFYATGVNGEVIACSRGIVGVYDEGLLEPLKLKKFSQFPTRELYFISRMVAHRDRNAGPALLKLMLAMYVDARRQGARIGIAHCRPDLVSMYSKIAWRPYAEPFHDPVSGEQVPILILAEDVDWIRDANPYLHALASLFINTNESSLWFEAQFLRPSDQTCKTGAVLPVLVSCPGDNVSGCNSSKGHGTVWQHAPSFQR
jgi:hypothetical protein